MQKIPKKADIFLYFSYESNLVTKLRNLQTFVTYTLVCNVTSKPKPSVNWNEKLQFCYNEKQFTLWRSAFSCCVEISRLTINYKPVTLPFVNQCDQGSMRWFAASWPHDAIQYRYFVVELRRRWMCTEACVTLYRKYRFVQVIVWPKVMRNQQHSRVSSSWFS